MRNNYLKILSFVVVFLMGVSVNAQIGNVGIGTNNPNESAILEIESINKGLLIPRMSLEKRNEIQSPAIGLLVFQTDVNSGFYFYNGQGWSKLSNNDAYSVASDPNDWSFGGNSAPVGAFLGTTNTEPILFKVNNVWSGKVGGSVTFLGVNAGNSSTSGANNVAIGNESSKSITTGINNVSIGRYSMRLNTSGQANVALGSSALRDNSTGVQNVGIGWNALLTNTSGDYNMAIGTQTLGKNTTGSGNTGIGTSVLLDLVSGDENIGIGLNALVKLQNGSKNIGIGTQTLFQNLTGTGNLALGYKAGYNETGSNKLYISNSSTVNPLIKGEFDNKNLKINTGATTSSTVGFLAVGNFDAAFAMPTGNSYRLIVQDGIITERVKVALKSTADWADYVFEPIYKSNMMSLEEVEEFTLENKHLPNVPSAQNMKDNGLEVGETSKMFMEKIEELTLYMIELNKDVKALKLENELLKSKLVNK
ncbi:hypothetical protein [Lacihabitans sp. LS3-19]|uniref:hypothetical protein n=1 Tax=Lacihabitans sp. LS3-19 TaxID=2487335 RepID=UPI0020CEEBFA|nr:hypothetical protein [Lacihabitans sp. LS3-19]